MRHLDLFSGILGFSEGFERNGIETMLACEQDNNCQHIIRYHRPGLEVVNDVREISKANIPVQPDLISAGVPCQDVSVAGQRAGLDGERTGLFFEFVRIVQEFQPPWIVFENVPGLLSSNEKRDFARVIGELGQCGYFLAYRVLDSQYWGVAQRRKRVFIVGSLGNTRCAEVLFESKSLPWNPKKSRTQEQEIAGSLGSHASGGWGNELDNTGAFIPEIAGTLDFGGHGGSYNGQDAINNRLISQTLRGGGDGGVPSSRGENLIVAPLTGNQYGDAVRRLTPRECERLQGFPDDWTRWGIDENGKKVEISDTQRYKMLGNAVTVNVTEWIGRRIVATDRAFVGE